MIPSLHYETSLGYFDDANKGQPPSQIVKRRFRVYEGSFSVQELLDGQETKIWNSFFSCSLHASV
jgi:hypothetical protein